MTTTMLLALFVRRNITVAIYLLAFSAYAQTTTLTGYIKGIGDQPIIFWYDVDGERQRDTVYATNDSFTYLPQPTDDGTIGLYISGSRFTHFWNEPGKITVTGDAKVPYKLIFRGSPENEILNQYQQEIGWKEFDDKQKEKAVSQFIREHPASRTAAELVYNIIRAASEDDEMYQELWNILSPAMQADYFGRKAEQKIKVLKTQPIIGRIAPNFIIPDTAGIDVSLVDFKGEYVLLDFWGHWCAPCIKSFPKVKALHEKYGDKLEIIGIAMERADDKEKWLSAIRKHKAYWTQLSDLNGDASETNVQYNVVEYPTYLLLDKNSFVLERSSNLEAIERKLTSLGDSSR